MYFLAGVADVEIFKDNELIIEGKTLLDSSITIGVSVEDIRAGKGAKLYGKYFHDTTFNLKVSDVMFKMEYLAENFGTDVKLGADTTVEERFIAIDTVGTCKLKHMPIPFNDDSNINIYWKNTSDKFYKTKRIEELSLDNTIKLGETKIGDVYCVKYQYSDDSIRKIQVGSEIVPNILSLYLTANLYKGDDNNLKTGTKVGIISIKIPKFLLSGNQEILLNMTGFSNNILEGSALSCKRDDCNESSYYAEIIEVIYDRSFSDLKSIKIYADEEGLFIHSDTIDTKLKVYANFDKYGLVVVNNEKVDFQVEDDNILRIDKNGVIHPISSGVTTITAFYKGMSASICVKILVYNDNSDNSYKFVVLINKNTHLAISNTEPLVYRKDNN